MGFRKNLFDKKYLYGFSLFSDNKSVYEMLPESKEEQLFMFYLAYKNGAKGDLIEYFKEKYLDEAKAREDELYRKFFKIYPTKNMPGALSKKVTSIYKEELEN